MSATDISIVDAIRSLADDADPRHATHVDALARSVEHALKALLDMAQGDRIAMGMDYLTLCRTLAIQRARAAELERRLTALETRAPPPALDLMTWRHEVVAESQKAIAEAWNLHDDRIVALEQRVGGGDDVHE